ncbi:hypothetical protein LSTR_LSTR009206 [Laodelphax striatellus]|uniref:Fasciclin-2 n=1 Tax=Laodelphax striatellus TaxID=195883 RepID=A0A482WRY2_LAOST|nr:hypothetical protein LSTR_LSTR009206 [Laodelphax striatellus]
MKPKIGLCFVSLTNAVELVIKPSENVQKKAVGKTLLLTCNLEGGDYSLLSEFEWRDPFNQVINSEMRRVIMPMTTERWADNKLALIIPQMKEEGSGNYTCSGVYAKSQKLTKSVTLQTFVSITWEDAPQEQNAIVNKDFKIKCRVTANPSPVVNWMKNDEPLTTNEHYVIEADGMVIRQVTEADDGYYKCRASVVDTGEIESRSIKVEVFTLPSFESTELIRKEVVEGETINIPCQASGKPPPTYTWIKSNTKQDLSVIGDRYAVNEITGVLTITNLRKEDTGDYICEARNGAGFVTRPVNLLVIVKPTVYEIRNISIPTGKEAKLECRASGYPLPSVTFRKFGLDKPFVQGAQQWDDRIVIEQRYDEQKRETTGTLIISQLSTADDDLYECIAENKGGAARRNGHLTVEYSPTFAHTPMKEAWSWSKRPINLTCLAEAIPNATIRWRLNEQELENWPHFQKYGNGPQSSLLVTPTDSKYYGMYKCVATNTHGTAYHTIRLQEARVPGNILQAKLELATATTVSFILIGPSDVGGLPIKAIVVQYKEHRRPWSEAFNKTWSYESSRTQNAKYILEGLGPQTTYDFRFAAVNEVGIGHWAADFKYTMPKRSSPEEPKILHAYKLDEEGVIQSPFGDRFELRWKIPADNGEIIDRFEVKYCAVIRNEEDQWEPVKESECKTIEHRTNEVSWLELVNLQPDTYYKIELRAHNLIGFSTPNEDVIRTARGTGTFIGPDTSQLSSTLLFAILIGILLLIFIIVDVSCFFVHHAGLLHLLCGKSARKQPREDDTKMTSLYSWRFPLPYCSNKETSPSDSNSNGNNSLTDIDLKRPLPDMNFVFEGKELLNSGHRDAKIHIESSTPMIDNNGKKDTTVQYDIKKSVAKTGFAKDSAV